MTFDWSLACGVAVGGALGSVLRYASVSWVQGLSGQDVLPYGTFCVNVAGAFVIGLLVHLASARQFPPFWRAGLVTGVLGGFTTFSSFSLETFTLLRTGHARAAVAYALASVLLCLAGVCLGEAAGRWLAPAPPEL